MYILPHEYILYIYFNYKVTIQLEKIVLKVTNNTFLFSDKWWRDREGKWYTKEGEKSEEKEREEE